ncbi:hypothetical protein OHA44_15140 [Streptomyces sp. NBC_00144]|uniref:hypothetical protein n=1 Tax=Streptomyces sp. NBC_00144 TaxID=2975665 RepID=UPI00324AAB9B
MSTTAPPPPVPGPQRAAAPDAPQPPPGDSRPAGPAQPTEPGEPEERSQEARAAQRELFAHAPEFILGSAASFGGSLVGGAQHGVSGGQVAGDVFLGGKTEIHHHTSAAGGSVHSAGEIPRAELDRLSGDFVEGPSFAAALERLRTERVLVLSGQHATGRRTAALMLLDRLGVPTVRALQPETGPSALPAQLTGSGGHVLCDMPLSRNRPLRDAHLYAAADRLKQFDDGYLVITVEASPYLPGVTPFCWEPPPAEEVLRAFLAARKTGGAETERLLTLDPVREFLAHGHHRCAEAAEFAGRLAEYDGTAAALAGLAGFSLSAVEKQCRDWLSAPDSELGLRDKAFLISLSVFDGAPYVLAAELGDRLFVNLQRLQHPEQEPAIPVFGPSAADRLALARAEGVTRNESTDWGPVPQYLAHFREPRTAHTLLTEVWTGHPSARPALVDWLKQLARDGRPMVRTRAAAAAAMLAAADLPSAMAALVDGWALSRSFGPRVTAANALTLAQLLEAPAILRLLTQWCGDAHWARRWTAIRAFALLAPVRPDLAAPALQALAARARAEDSSPAESRNLTESTALLLSGGNRGEMLAELVRLLQDTAPVRGLALAAFVRACESDEEGSLVDWYAESGSYDAGPARDLAMLWRTALGDRAHTKAALDALRTWLYAGERRPDAGQALTLLLPGLVTTAADHGRLDHLLRTLRSADGSPERPRIADRLLSVLNPRSA